MHKYFRTAAAAAVFAVAASVLVAAPSTAEGEPNPASASNTNDAGATLTVAPGVGLTTDGTSDVTVSGSGYGAAGVYLFYGYVNEFPTATTGNLGYTYQSSWFMPTVTNGAFSASVADVPTTFEAPAGFGGTAGTVDCLSGEVQCGFFTLGKHGAAYTPEYRNFVPVYFEGQVAPEVTQQPADALVSLGDDVTFTAAASGNPAPSVAWESSTDGGATWTAIAGATTTTLAVDDVTSESAGQYRAVFTNGLGAATTEAAALSFPTGTAANTNDAGATLTVTPAEGLNTDGTSSVTVSGSGYGAAGVYLFYGYVHEFPTATSGSLGYTYQSSWFMPTVTNGAFSASVADVPTTFQAPAGFGGTAGTVDCLSGEVQCGFFTLGKHAAAYTPEYRNFVPVYFEGDSELAFTTAPVDTTVTVLEDATFTAAASGSTAPALAWQTSTNNGESWTTVSGATGTELTLSELPLSASGTWVRSVATNPFGELVSDHAVLTVTEATFAFVPVPSVTGTVRVGSTLSIFTDGSWDPARDSTTYQWNRAGLPISGATKTQYVLTAADLGKRITVTVTGSKVNYETTSVTSPATTAVLAGVITPGSASVSGTAKVGLTLTAKTVTAKPSGVAKSYQWYRSGAAIKGATKSTYVAGASDRGKQLSVKVTYKKSGYTTVAKTVKSSKVVAAGTITRGKVAITGTAKVGKKLTVVKTGTKPSAVATTQQWYRNGKAIKGATKTTYTVKKTDKGASLKVKVTYKKSGYTTTTLTTSSKRVS